MSANEDVLNAVPPGTTAGLTRRDRIGALHAAVDAHVEDALEMLDKMDLREDCDYESVGTLLDLAVTLNLLALEAQNEIQKAVAAATKAERDGARS